MDLHGSSHVIVPHGWQRLIQKESVVYVSPDKILLRSREEVLRHLTSTGTCKCGLKCPFAIDEQFNFDPVIIGLADSRPYTGYSLCKVKPSLYVNKRKKPASRKAISSPMKPKVVTTKDQSPRSKTSPLLKPVTIPLTSISHKTINDIHSSKNIGGITSTLQSPRFVLSHSTGDDKPGEVSYPVVDLQALVNHLNSVAKSSPGKTTPTNISLPLVGSIQLKGTANGQKGAIPRFTIPTSSKVLPRVGLVPGLCSPSPTRSPIPGSPSQFPAHAISPNTSILQEDTPSPNKLLMKDITPSPTKALISDATPSPNTSILQEDTPSPNKALMKDGTPSPTKDLITNVIPSPTKTVIPDVIPSPTKAVIDVTPSPTKALIPDVTPSPTKALITDIIPLLNKALITGSTPSPTLLLHKTTSLVVNSPTKVCPSDGVCNESTDVLTLPQEKTTLPNLNIQTREPSSPFHNDIHEVDLKVATSNHSTVSQPQAHITGIRMGLNDNDLDDFIIDNDKLEKDKVSERATLSNTLKENASTMEVKELREKLNDEDYEMDTQETEELVSGEQKDSIEKPGELMVSDTDYQETEECNVENATAVKLVEKDNLECEQQNEDENQNENKPEDDHQYENKPENETENENKSEDESEKEDDHQNENESGDHQNENEPGDHQNETNPEGESEKADDHRTKNQCTEHQNENEPSDHQNENEPGDHQNKNEPSDHQNEDEPNDYKNENDEDKEGDDENEDNHQTEYQNENQTEDQNENQTEDQNETQTENQNGNETKDDNQNAASDSISYTDDTNDSDWLRDLYDPKMFSFPNYKYRQYNFRKRGERSRSFTSSNKYNETKRKKTSVKSLRDTTPISDTQSEDWINLSHLKPKKRRGRKRRGISTESVTTTNSVNLSDLSVCKEYNLRKRKSLSEGDASERVNPLPSKKVCSPDDESDKKESEESIRNKGSESPDSVFGASSITCKSPVSPASSFVSAQEILSRCNSVTGETGIFPAASPTASFVSAREIPNLNDVNDGSSSPVSINVSSPSAIFDIVNTAETPKQLESVLPIITCENRIFTFDKPLNQVGVASNNLSREGSCEIDDISNKDSEKKQFRRVQTSIGSDRQSTSSFDSEHDHYSTLTKPDNTDDGHLVVRFPYKLLPHHFVMQCYSGHSFQIGDVVWAKASMLPSWPGRIISHTEVSKRQPPPSRHVWIRWFNSDTVSLVEEDNLKPLMVGYEAAKRNTPKRKHMWKKIEIAMKEAVAALREREEQLLMN